MSPDFSKKKKMDVKDIFNQDEDDDGFGSARKRTLVPLGNAYIRNIGVIQFYILKLPTSYHYN